jgi:hypothetical protein
VLVTHGLPKSLPANDGRSPLTTGGRLLDAVRRVIHNRLLIDPRGAEAKTRQGRTANALIESLHCRGSAPSPVPRPIPAA